MKSFCTVNILGSVSTDESVASFGEPWQALACAEKTTAFFGDMNAQSQTRSDGPRLQTFSPTPNYCNSFDECS